MKNKRFSALETVPKNLRNYREGLSSWINPYGHASRRENYYGLLALRAARAYRHSPAADAAGGKRGFGINAWPQVQQVCTNRAARVEMIVCDICL